MKEKRNPNANAGAAKGLSVIAKILVVALAVMVVVDAAIVGCILHVRKQQSANDNAPVEVVRDKPTHMQPDDQTMNADGQETIEESAPQKEEGTVAFAYTVVDPEGNLMGAHSLEIYCADTGKTEVREFSNGKVELYLQPGYYTFTVCAEKYKPNSFYYTVSGKTDNNFYEVQLGTKMLIDLETFEKLSKNASGIHGDFVNDDSAEFEEAMWNAIYWAADCGRIKTQWDSTVYGYSYPIADAEQYCLETFGRAPSDLWSSCPDFPFISNDGTYLTQDFLPGDTNHYYRIFRVEHIDDDHLLFYRTTDTTNSTGEHKDYASFCLYLLEA